jgi:hypothetical protein
MNGQSRKGTSLAIAIAACVAALALLVPADRGSARSARDVAGCPSPTWAHILTGPIGAGGCR